MESTEDSSLSTNSKLSDVLKCHPDFLDRLALSLDRNMRLIPNWKQLARELNVDEDVVEKLEQYKDQSPTIRLFEYLEVTQPQLTIQQLRNAMLDIRRNDLFSLLTTKGHFAGFERVQEVMTSKPHSPSASLLDEIALALDATSLVLANWYQLAIKLGVRREDCWNFERRSTQSPTNELFQYLEATRPQMTLKKLKEALNQLKRMDLLYYLDNQSLEDGAYLKDVMTPGSELLQTMADKLNREIPGIKDWHHLACKLEVPVDIRQAFGGVGPKGKSPTKEVMQWLVARFPDTTLKDVVKALDKIQRNDAIQIITRQFPDTVDSSLERLDSSLYDNVSMDLPVNDPTGETLSTRYKREECGSFKASQMMQRKHMAAIETRRLFVLPDYESILGDHPFVATTLSWIANSYHALGDFDNAIKFTQRALEIRERLLGDHQETARSFYDLGVALSAKEEYESALQILEKAVLLQEEVLDTHDELIHTHQAMSIVLKSLGREEEAEREMELAGECAKRLDSVEVNLEIFQTSEEMGWVVSDSVPISRSQEHVKSMT